MTYTVRHAITEVVDCSPLRIAIDLPSKACDLALNPPQKFVNCRSQLNLNFRSSLFIGRNEIRYCKENSPFHFPYRLYQTVVVGVRKER
ncbi:hypothetical protein NPIL_402631 [Nephila pilipes]|uniref:Uncharacterized protein n=1 Tax=Nephila pilipes TaxID=299642 RepID=A0A8X6Q6T5_NEPPI|nr:hypothetical protein NPIL_402631 [Nephila pilipes]